MRRSKTNQAWNGSVGVLCSAMTTSESWKHLADRLRALVSFRWWTQAHDADILNEEWVRQGFHNTLRELQTSVGHSVRSWPAPRRCWSNCTACAPIMLHIISTIGASWSGCLRSKDRSFWEPCAQVSRLARNSLCPLCHLCCPCPSHRSCRRHQVSRQY